MQATFQGKSLYFISVISFLIFITMAQGQSGWLQKCREGFPILTRLRNSNNTNQLKYQCLCPIDFIGSKCGKHRQIRCYLTKSNMTPAAITTQNYQQSIEVKLSLNAECYIEYQDNKFKPLFNFIVQRQSGEQKLLYELESGVNGGQIIWANNSDLFDQNGNVKYQLGYNYTLDQNGQKRLSKSDQQRVINGKGPLKFQYKDKFLGFPLSDSKFYIYSTVIRPTQNRIPFKKQQLSFQNVEQLEKILNQTKNTGPQLIRNITDGLSIRQIIQNPEKLQNILDKTQDIQKRSKDLQKISDLPLFSIKLTVNPKQAAEFHNIRLQITIKEFYTKELYVTPTGINSVQFFIPINVPGIAEPEVYNITFNKKQLSRYVYAAILLLILLIIYIIYILRSKAKKQKLREIQKNIDEAQQDVQWK